MKPSIKKMEDLSILLLDKDTNILSCQQSKDEKWRFLTSPDDVPKLYLDMLIHFEDRRFYYHPGIDPLAIVRSIFQGIKNGKVISGASTITMQVVRLLTPRPRTIWSKILEAIEAIHLELFYTKKEILTFYLTLTPEGNNFEGVFSAAFGYFQKKPKDLNTAEIALLIAIPQSPTKLRPNGNIEKARQARNKVLQRCTLLLSSKEIEEAQNYNLPTSRYAYPTHAQHLLHRLKHTPIIHTSLDGTLQKCVQKLILAHFTPQDQNRTLAVLIVENKTKKVRSYIGSYNYFDVNRYGYVDMIRAVRSPGSTLKPFIYAKAYDLKIIDQDTLVMDNKKHFGDYSPHNFMDTFHGEVTIYEALQQSLNVPAVLLLEKIGPKRFLHDFQNLPVYLHLPKDKEAALPIALGGVGITLDDLTSLFVSLANNGEYAPLVFEENQIESSVPVKQICEKESAQIIKKILQDAPVPNGYIQSSGANTVKIAFKTGTSYGGRDALCVGYTKDYTVAVWMGRADGTAVSDNIGRLNAAPLVFSIFHSLLPNPLEEDELSVAKSLRPSHLKKIEAQSEKKIRIVCPHDGAKILKSNNAIVLKINDPCSKVTWLVNQTPLKDHLWIPRDVGFYTLTAINLKGESTSIHVRVIS